MTQVEFKAIKIGDKVRNGIRSIRRTVDHVYDDQSGARIIHTRQVRGCSKTIDNLDTTLESHYSNWRVE